MATPPKPFLCLYFFTLLLATSHAADHFTFNGFAGADREILRDGVSILKPSGAMRLTSAQDRNAIGRAFHNRPIHMLNQTNASSFATTFVFSIASPNSGKGGFGLAFVLAASTQFPGAAANHYLGLFNEANDGQTSNHIFAVEFDTVNGLKDARDTDGNHVGINVNSMTSVATASARVVSPENQEQEVMLKSGDPIQAWVEYDAVSKRINVTVSPAGTGKPITPLLSKPLDLTSVFKEFMYAGFSASTGEVASSHYILGWSFSTNGNPAPPLDISQLPPSPGEKSPPRFKPLVIALISALCAVTVALLGVLVFVTLYKRFMMRFEALEDWELECPHRFRYGDLYSGTRGFSDSEMIGVGGFGAVYRAIIPDSGSELAVKKITRNSIQGIREFAAEIESLGRLRHKNLVNLQGWCKHKNDLLLVYDYIPNGSLDYFLYDDGGGRRSGVGLSWEQRFRVLKGIAAGLLYLHEEWEQVVIHRDVKSSNVLIDGDMNGRLGDFGLARLYNHGTASHTTNVVGTVGYIAPELARTGKASTWSDVFAFGVLLLETASGKRPIDESNFILVDWVMECLQMGSVLDAADPRLERRYAAEEMEMVLRLGLICSHPRQEGRPTMRQVVRCLNGEDEIPGLDESGLDDDVRESARRGNLRLLEVISATDGVSDMYSSSSIGGASVNSIYDGR